MGFENGKLVRVVLSATNTVGNTEVNVLHYDLQDSSIPGDVANDPQALADRFRDDVIPAFAALFDNTWTVNPVVVEEERDPQHPNAAREGWTSGAPTPGTNSAFGDHLPNAVTVVVTLLTGLLGRRFRGRMFIPGTWSEADQGNGAWQSGALARVAAYIDAIPLAPDVAEGATASSAAWCVYSRTQRAQHLDPYAPAIVGTHARTPVHWLRSRER